MSGQPKTLLLLRHAKSSWDDPAMPDVERPLARRGRDATPLIGREIRRRGWLPDMAIVSTAVRTRQTWDLVFAELGSPVDVRFEPSIYEAPAATILEAIRSTPANIATLLVIGHNPGLEELAALISSPESDADAIGLLREKFPTAALARFELNRRWLDIGHGAAALIGFVRPKQLH